MRDSNIIGRGYVLYKQTGVNLFLETKFFVQIVDDSDHSLENKKKKIKNTNSRIFKESFLKFVVLPTIALSVVAVISIDPTLWVMSGIDHVYFEIVSVVLASIAAAYCLTRGYVLQDKFSLFIGIGFGAAAVIDLLHGIFSFLNLDNSPFEAYFIPQTWVAGRILLSLVMLIAIAKFSRLSIEHKQTSVKTSAMAIVLGLAGLATIITTISLFQPLPFVTIDFPIHRPYEIASAALLIIGIFYFFKNKLHEKQDAFYKGILLVLVVDVFVNIIISYSGHVFDTEFGVAHLLKNVSYLVFVLTLATSLAQNFKHEQITGLKLKASENILRRNFTEMKKIEREKEEFSAMISHELKTPITPIMMWADALREPNMLGKLTPEQKNAVDKISESAEQLKQLVGDMFDAYKLDLNKIAFVQEPLLVNKTVHEIVNSFEAHAKKKNISITCPITETIEIRSDERRIQQVLKNLINNAIDFVEKDKGLITVNAVEKDDSVLFSVKDNGMGISKDNLKQLFKKFYQIDKSYTREHGGSGLGLSISKGVVEGLGGKIWVESKLGAGTEFYFTIPKEM